MMKGQRRLGNGFDLSEAPSHLIRRCQQFYGDLYAREAGSRELTKQQFTLLCALEKHDGVSQTVLVDVTGIEPTAHAFPVVNVWADDVAQPGLPVEAALRNAPAQRENMIAVPKVVE